MNIPKIQKFYVNPLFKSNQTHDNIADKPIFKSNFENIKFSLSNKEINYEKNI